MEHIRIFSAVICLLCSTHAIASSLRSDSSSFLSRQQQFLLISEGAASNEQRLVNAPQADQKAALVSVVPSKANQKVALLSVVQGLQSNTRQKSTYNEKVNLSERRLLSNMGQLEHQLESWKSDVHRVEQQVSKTHAEEKPKEVDSTIDGAAAWKWAGSHSRNALFGLAMSMMVSVWFFGIMLLSRKQSKPKASLQQIGDALEAPPAIKEPVPTEVSKHLADLVDAIGKVKMPSEIAVQAAMQAMEANEPDGTIICKEVVTGTTTESNE